MTNPMAKDASHLFFGSAFPSSLFATHPPLGLRISRLLPHWNGEFKEVSLRPISEESEQQTSRKSKRPSPPVASGMFFNDGAAPVQFSSEEAVESFRSVHAEQVELGAVLHEQLPTAWIEACRSRAGSQSMVFALLLAQDESLRNAELSRLRQATDEVTFQIVSDLYGEVNSVHSAVKIGLIDLSIPALKHLSPAEYARFKTIIQNLISSDGRVDLFEFMLLQVITRHLDTYFHQRNPEKIKYGKIHPLVDDAGVLLSTLAAMSHPNDEATTRRSFEAAAGRLRQHYSIKVPFKESGECGLDRIKKVLENFAHASPVLKRNLLEACSISVMADQGVSSREAELIRAVADSIGCPIPPFVRTGALV